MAVFSITRSRFLDRVFSIDQLASLTEMLRLWYRAARKSASADAQLQLQARIYAFARIDGDAIRQALASRLQNLSFDLSDPDEMVLQGQPQSVEKPADISIWRQVLSEPLLSRVCVRLRVQFGTRIAIIAGKSGPGKTTFTLCGAPHPKGMFVKSIWRCGPSENDELLYRYNAWRREALFIQAFDFYLEQCGISPAESAANLAWNAYRKEDPSLFTTSWVDAKIKTLAGYFAEVAGNRGPAAFLRRLGIPLLICACSLLPLLWLESSSPAAALCVVFAIVMFLIASRVVSKKIRYIRASYVASRREMEALCSHPINLELVDLSTDQSPTLFKYSREIEALGRHICDVNVYTAQGFVDSNRIFVMGNSIVCLAYLHKFQKLGFFPALSILTIATEFVDGRSHMTTNVAHFRKLTAAGTTARCLIDEASLEKLLDAHDRSVKKIIAAGSIPKPPPITSAAILEWIRQGEEEMRQAWEKSPYSWSDAIQQGFNLCRKEYLAD